MNITIFGSRGRVGSAAVRIAKQRGHVVTEIDVDTPLPTNGNADVAIDFSLPSATKRVVDYCTVRRCPLISGVTGRDEGQQKLLDELAKFVPVKCCANFSEGANLLRELCETIAAKHPKWDTDIIETHRREKLDTPSGTAKQLAASVVQAKGAFAKVTVHSLRSGTEFGEHTVVFGADGESLVLTHRAQTVDVFAIGAINTAERIVAATNKQN